ATEQLDEAVISTAASERRLLPPDARGIDLEGRPRVVVETAHETRIQPVPDAERVEMGADSGEMCRAGLAEEVGDPRRVGVELDHRRFLRVEQAERAALQALP